MGPEGESRDYQQAVDKTMHATLSLYINSERMEEVFSNWNPETQRLLQSRQRETRQLSRAIDPLFNDIAIRDRNAVVEEFLIDLDGARFVEPVRITVPDRIAWETEGQQFEARLGGEIQREVAARTFWYVHSNGALSFHISMLLQYEHRLADFYFLSMLQKLMFPKEFEAVGEVNAAICSGRTGVWVLDHPTVRCRAEIAGDEGQNIFDDGGDFGFRGDLPFWTFVRRLTCRQISMLTAAAGLKHRVSPVDDREIWRALVACDATSFVEIPGLKAPPARSVFLLLDREFFDLLQPGARDRLRVGDLYRPLIPAESKRNATVVLDIPAIEAVLDGAPAGMDVRYYFLSGFFQNIIDFLNQDVSELRDGTDPVFPRTAEQQDEALFIRFANSRSLFQVVASSRSLEVGNDYIGTCPYLFLVHLMALHNEYLVQRYEGEIASLQMRCDAPSLTRLGNLRSLLAAMSKEAGGGAAVPAREIQKATAEFYQFRLKAFTFFKRHLYDNTLRYDTERDLFDELQRIRGVATRLARCDGIVDGLDRTIKDLEDDKRYRDQAEARKAEGRLAKLLGVVGFFGIAQASFQAVDTYRQIFEGNTPKCDIAKVFEASPCTRATYADMTSLLVLFGTAAGMVIVIYFLIRLAFTPRDE
ncbi:MAG: hypothetical protein AB7E81_16645 [Hyphomicrobiaceae bacterium]